MTTAPTPDALPRWDLDAPLGGTDPVTIARATDAVVADLEALTEHYDRLGVDTGAGGGAPTAPELAGLLDAHNATADRLRTVGAVLHGLVSVNSRDEAAVAARSSLASRTTAMGRLTTRLNAWAATLPLEDLAAESVTVATHRYPLARAADLAARQMGSEAEALVGELRLSGSVAWANLHRDLSAQLTGRLEVPAAAPTDLPVTALRALASDPDPAVRRAAHTGEVAAWSTAAHALAATLNGAFGERIVLDRRRGWPDRLAPALWANGVERPVLEAMQAAVAESLPTFRRYLRAKAALGGHAGGLPWWDLSAPVGSVGTRSWDEAVTQVLDAFDAYDPELAGLARRAVDERWIDAGPRAGKVGGAFCMGVGDGASRVLLNFDGAATGMLSLAHELGHAYHGHRLADRTALQRRTPMTLAETASVFCETLTLEAALADAGAEDELGLLELDLRGATQIVVDIQSRFWFEEAALAARAERTCSPDELCGLLDAAQERAYGDGIAPETRHPFMWAVKGHYFTPFYNWPYTFGLLFALGLHTRYRADPGGFRPRYDALLADTGTASPADLARRFGIEIGDVGFWRDALGVIEGRIARFVALTGQIQDRR